MNANEIIRRPLVTEKSTLLREGANVIAFEVSPKANKIQVKHAVEELFKVKV
jgi:large subunit ribosomal protein L23